jgi:hypothetical protein
MDADFTQPTSGTSTTIGRKAWTAYVGVVLGGIVLIVIPVPIAWHI